MVFFICEACGETLKKNKVDQHSWSCKGCWVLACMDCGRRFEGEAYKEHVSCMSEAEKYEGKLYQHKENKGEAKQRSWTEVVQQRLDAAPGGSQLKPYAERLLAYENLPRKKAKFINFAKNSLNLKADREGIAEKLWTLIDESSSAAETAAAAVCNACPTAAAPVPAPAAAPAAAAPAEAGEKKRKLPDEAAETAGAGAERTAAKQAKKAAKQAKAEPAKANGAAAAAGAGASASSQGKEDKKAKKAAKKAKLEAAAAAAAAAAGDGSKEARGKRPERPAGEHKPVKWKKIIAKELESEGGSMKLKELRSASIKEAKAHPSHQDRDAKSLREDFDAHIGAYTGKMGKFMLDGKRVKLAPVQ